MLGEAYEYMRRVGAHPKMTFKMECRLLAEELFNEKIRMTQEKYEEKVKI